LAKRVEEHAFSIEIKSERFVRRISFLDKEASHVFFEGFLGQLKSVSLIEGLMLEIEGENGMLRVDITQKEIDSCFEAKKLLGGEQ